jgi:hypothetical protein
VREGEGDKDEELPDFKSREVWTIQRQELKRLFLLVLQ